MPTRGQTIVKIIVVPPKHKLSIEGKTNVKILAAIPNYNRLPSGMEGAKHRPNS